MKKHRGRHLLSLLASAALLASLLPAAFAAEAEGEKHITILGTSDMHGNIWGYSYEDNAETDNNGMARLYTYIQQVRAENPNTFLVDAGDDIQGTIMTDDLYNKTPEEPHPVVTAMNYMGYDAMTLGNHEFNWGIPTMQTILSQAEFPVLAANVTDAAGELVTGAGWTIVERDASGWPLSAWSPRMSPSGTAARTALTTPSMRPPTWPSARPSTRSATRPT